MEIRRSCNYEELKKFYRVLRKEDTRRAGKKPKKPVNNPVAEGKLTRRAEKAGKRLKVGAAQPPLRQKIQKPKSKPGKNAADKRAKKAERLQRVEGKLLMQLEMIQQRMERMDKDKERYALVDMERADHKYIFTIVKIGDPTKVVIKVDKDFATTCSCMDWRIRCRGIAIPCKHLYYLLKKILTYELYDFYDNTVLLPAEFEALVQRRINKARVEFKVKEGDSYEEEACPICFLDFKEQRKIDEVVRCQDCRHFIHRQCMRTWLQNSPRRNCVMCRSETWNLFFN